MNSGNSSTEGIAEPWETISAYGPVDDFDLHPVLRRAYRVAVLIERAPHASVEQTAASSAAFGLVEEMQNVVLGLMGKAMLAKAKADAYDQLIAKTPDQAPIARVTVTEGDFASVVMYAPGLPPGDHDLYCVPHPGFAPEPSAEQEFRHVLMEAALEMVLKAFDSGRKHGVFCDLSTLREAEGPVRAALTKEGGE